jgi:hypothetical protein
LALGSVAIKEVTNSSLAYTCQASDTNEVSMHRLRLMVRRLLAPVLVAALCFGTRSDGALGRTPVHMSFPSVMPPTVLWAWEEPEDLSAASSNTVGVAFLAETLFLGADSNGYSPGLRVVHRHQPLKVGPGTPVMAVVRIIALADFQDSADLRRRTSQALIQVAHQNGVRALQIDFDATRSQRGFYTDLLRQVRPRLPAGMPLSITALLSWCTAAPGEGDWLAQLPIDEAVPMYFRLGGSHRPAGDKTSYRIREPLCQGSNGISTDESWPLLDARARIYLFAPHPWTAPQLAALNSLRSGHRDAALQAGYDAATAQPNDTGLPPPAHSANPLDTTTPEHPNQENLP